MFRGWDWQEKAAGFGRQADHETTGRSQQRREHETADDPVQKTVAYLVAQRPDGKFCQPFIMDYTVSQQNSKAGYERGPGQRYHNESAEPV